MANCAKNGFRQPARQLMFACCVLMAPVLAQAGDWTGSANIAVTSDYVFRGISQTDGNPALQAGAEASHASGFNMGIWGSNVDFNDGHEANVEIDYDIGFGAALTDALEWDAKLFYYTYPGADHDLHYDYLEGKLGLAYTVKDAALSPTLGVDAYFSPEYFGQTGNATYVAGTLGLTLMEGLGVNASIGHQDLSGEGMVDYFDWKLGLTKELAGFNLELAYTDTDLKKSDCGDTDICDGRVLLTLSKDFE